MTLRKMLKNLRTIRKTTDFFEKNPARGRVLLFYPFNKFFIFNSPL